MTNKMTFELVSPESLMLSVQAEMIVVPGTEGDFGVLAGHAPFMSTVRPGVVEVHEGGSADVRRLFVRGGFADVLPDTCTILAEQAIDIADVDVEETSKALADARFRVERAKEPREKSDAELEVQAYEALMNAVTS
ncbi:MAG: F0F1 ATP synthase subunit epsilon [Pseudomonadota bacterium]